MKDWVPKPHQEHGVKFMLERGCAGLFIPPGFGKTTISLAVHKLLREHDQVRRTLVICPKNPMFGVWPVEVQKWNDFHDIGVEVLHGSDKDEKLARLDPHKQLYVINFDGLKWLIARIAEMKTFPFEMLIVDESAHMRDTNTLRFKLLKPLLSLFKRRYILTGDPAPNSLIDLFGQMYIMDRGATFGPFITHFRNKYFNATGYGGYTFIPKENTDKEIRAALAPRVYTLTEEDQKGLPPITYNTIEFEFSQQTRHAYAQFKRKLKHDFPSGDSITAKNMGVLTNMLQQFTGGAVYNTEHQWEWVHDEKLEVLEELIRERQGRPTVIVYRFNHELERMLKLFGKDTPHFGGKMGVVELVEKWNAGDIPILLAQEQSMSFGLNMQEVEAAIVWFYITASNERYRQLIRRVYRTGQKYPVVVHHLVAKHTWDERGLSILAIKDRQQSDLLSALREYWRNELAQESGTKTASKARRAPIATTRARIPVARAAAPRTR